MKKLILLVASIGLSLLAQVANTANADNVRLAGTGAPTRRKLSITSKPRLP